MDNIMTTDLRDLPAPTGNAVETLAWCVKLRKAQIKAICLFAADEGCLNQVWFQSGRMYATDGHRLAIMGHDLSKENCTIKHAEGYGIAPQHLESMAKSMRVGDSLVITDIGCRLMRKDGSVAEVSSLLPTVDDEQKFPPAQCVVPWANIEDMDRKADRGCPTVNGRYLADAAQAPTLAGYTRADVLHHVRVVASANDLDPLLVVADHKDSDVQAIVVVMPINRS